MNTLQTSATLLCYDWDRQTKNKFEDENKTFSRRKSFVLITQSLTTYFATFKNFYMPVFGCFLFWTPTHFLEAIRRRYGHEQNPCHQVMFTDNTLSVHGYNWITAGKNLLEENLPSHFKKINCFYESESFFEFIKNRKNLIEIFKW